MRCKVPSSESTELSSKAIKRSPLAVEGRWLSRLVVEDVLNLFHYLIRQLRQELKRFDVIVDLMRLGRAKNDLSDIVSLLYAEANVLMRY